MSNIFFQHIFIIIINIHLLHVTFSLTICTYVFQFQILFKPAHAKQALLGGPSITVPITNGQLALGTWQGIWLCEHRNSGCKFLFNFIISYLCLISVSLTHYLSIICISMKKMVIFVFIREPIR